MRTEGPLTLRQQLSPANPVAGSIDVFAKADAEVWSRDPAGNETCMSNPTTRVATTHAISTIAATEVTGLKVAGVIAGTYVFEYILIVQSATATVSPMYGVNFTGTSAVRKMRMEYSDAGADLLTATNKASAVGTTAVGFHMSQSVTAFSTTAPNMGHIGGVGTINADTLVTIKGILVVTATGDLQLWHGSETATATSIMANSALILTKVA